MQFHCEYYIWSGRENQKWNNLSWKRATTIFTKLVKQYISIKCMLILVYLSVYHRLCTIFFFFTFFLRVASKETKQTKQTFYTDWRRFHDTSLHTFIINIIISCVQQFFFFFLHFSLLYFLFFLSFLFVISHGVFTRRHCAVDTVETRWDAKHFFTSKWLSCGFYRR